MRILHDGTWKLAFPWVRQNGTWVRSFEQHTRVSGEWELVIPNSRLYFAGQITTYINTGTSQSPNWQYLPSIDPAEVGYVSGEDLGEHIRYMTPIEAFPSLDTKIVNISASRFGILMIDHRGYLYGVGDNDYGQLGTGNNTHYLTPILVNDTLKWKWVHTQSNSGYAITHSGDLYVTGRNQWGQLGLGDTTHRTSFTKITGSNWSRICARFDSPAAIRTNGDLYTWGRNQWGLLGRGIEPDWQGFEHTPAQVGSSPWLVVTGDQHKVGIRADNGRMYAWGRDMWGSFGRGDIEDHVDSPIQIGGNNEWKDVIASSETTLGIRTNGDMYGTGRNWYGELGLGHADEVYEFTKMGTSKWNRFVSISPYVAIMAERSDGVIFGWGAGRGGLLGLGDEQPRNTPEELPTPGAGNDTIASAANPTNSNFQSFGFRIRG